MSRIPPHRCQRTYFEQCETRLYLSTVAFEVHNIECCGGAAGAQSVAAADLDGDGDLDVLSASSGDDKIAWYENLSRLVGDSNRDGVFDSADLVLVFKAGEYEDGIVGNSTFEEGDWNGDGDFDSADLVLAFQAGHYERSGQAGLEDLASAVDSLCAANDRWR